MEKSSRALSNSPRKLPRQGRSPETVRAIVEAAARILETRGHAGYNTNAVAHAAGVSPGSLYQYFPNKAALTKALIIRETSAFLAACDSAGATTGGREGIAHFVAAAIQHQLHRPTLARLLDVEEARIPDDPDLRRVTERAEAIIMQTLAHHSVPAQEDMTIASRDVLAIIKGMVDAAGASSESDVDSLNSRILRAVHGYLWSS